jgi:hypothetical protein
MNEIITVTLYKSLPELIEGLREHMTMSSHSDKDILGLETILANNGFSHRIPGDSILGFFCTSCSEYFNICIKNLTPVDKKIIGNSKAQAELPQKIRSSEFFGF